MRKLILAACGVLALGAPGMAQADVTGDIRAFCEKEWPDEFSMQEYCIKEETSSQRSLERVRQSEIDAHPIAAKIYRKCLNEWTDEFIEWSMVEYCIKEEAGSYNRLHPDDAIDLD